ncbi:hypothetical protein ACKC5O_12495 [Aeromonas schubertii]|nr:hypothetical protein [Aeromonas schubertii]
MAIYYVLERVLQAKHLNDGDTTERLKWFESCYVVESSKSYGKKFIYVFKDYEPALAALNVNINTEGSGELVILRQVNAWTSRGAAKKGMLGKGIVLFYPTAQEIEAKKKDDLLGALMLHAMEGYNIPPEEMHSLQADLEGMLDDSHRQDLNR